MGLVGFTSAAVIGWYDSIETTAGAANPFARQLRCSPRNRTRVWVSCQHPHSPSPRLCRTNDSLVTLVDSHCATRRTDRSTAPRCRNGNTERGGQDFVALQEMSLEAASGFSARPDWVLLGFLWNYREVVQIYSSIQDHIVSICNKVFQHVSKENSTNPPRRW